MKPPLGGANFSCGTEKKLKSIRKVTLEDNKNSGVQFSPRTTEKSCKKLQKPAEKTVEIEPQKSLQKKTARSIFPPSVTTYSHGGVFR